MEAGIEQDAIADDSMASHGTSAPAGHQARSGLRSLSGQAEGPQLSRFFGPSPRRPLIATLSPAMRVAGRIARDQPRASRPGRNRKARTMKHITGTALRVTACAVLLVAAVALLAGQDDIRKFHRMRSM